MTIPSTGDLNMWDGALINNSDWDANFTQLVTYLTNGNYDVTFSSVSATNFTGLPTTTFTLVAGEDINEKDILRMYGGLAYKATNANSAGITNIIGVATTTTAAAGTVTIGFDYFSSFTGLTANTKYFIGVDGALTATEPSEYPYEVGTAVSTTRINFNLYENKTPSGTVIPFSLATAPAGYILCNGSNISRTTHARLFGVIGTTYGVGDGATTFGLPDLRAEFIRGLDLSRGVDTGRAIGTSQADATAVNGLAVTGVGDHQHTLNKHTGPSANYRLTWQTAYTSPLVLGDQSTNAAGAHTHALTGDTETRGRNVALAYCIKL
tara:strand:- start:708 stop:1676 length:969 start_codon:yes stop_codon:yes gene_type:complete